MGVLLLATYLFVKESIIDGHAYIKKPPTFFKDHLSDYAKEAEGIIESMESEKDVLKLFKAGNENETDTIYTIL